MLKSPPLRANLAGCERPGLGARSQPRRSSHWKNRSRSAKEKRVRLPATPATAAFPVEFDAKSFPDGAVQNQTCEGAAGRFELADGRRASKRGGYIRGGCAIAEQTNGT